MRLIYLILVFFSLRLCAEETGDDYCVRAVLEGEPAANAQGCVNAVSGDYFISEQDLVVRGVEPIVVSRFYSSRSRRWPLFAWTKLGIDGDDIIAAEPTGGSYVYKKDGHKWRLKKARGMSNTAAGTIGGRTNLLNQYIEKKNGYYVLHAADGTKRFYKRNRKYTGYTKEPKIGAYCLQKEELPNGNYRIYHHLNYEKKFDLLTDIITGREGFGVYARLHLDWDESRLRKITTSDGREIYFDRNRSIKRKPVSLLSTNYGYSEEFIYSSKHYRMVERKLPLGRYQIVDYYDKKRVEVGGEHVKLKDKHDAPFGRVQRLWLPSGPDGEKAPMIDVLYKHKGKKYRNETTFVDPYGKKTVYAYFHNRRPSSIKHVGSNSTLTEIYDWESTLLKTKKYKDTKGEEFWKREFSYDKRGNVLEEKLSARGADMAKTLYFYDKYDHLCRVDHPNGKQELFVFLGEKSLLNFKSINNNEEVTQFSYDRHDLLSEVVDISNGIKKFKKINPVGDGPARGLPEVTVEGYYDGNAPVTLKTTKFFYNDHLLPIKEEIYDGDGVLLYSIDKEFDLSGNVLSETNAVGQKARYVYNAFGQKVEEVDFAGVVKKHFYDLMGRPILEQVKGPDGLFRQVENGYDKLNRKIFTSDYFGNRTYFEYDSFGYVIKTIKPDGTVHLHERDEVGNELSFVDSNGHKTVRTFNGLGKVISITYPNNSIQKIGYYTDGKIKYSIDPTGTVKEFAYNYRGDVTLETTRDPFGKILEQKSQVYVGSYLMKKTDAAGVVTRFTYDKAGRKIAEDTNGDVTTFTYDKLGRLWKTQILDVVRVQEYDILNRVVEERVEDPSGLELSRIEYGYDFAGNRSEVTKYVEGVAVTEKTLFDSFARPIQQVDARGDVVYFAYDEKFKNEQGLTVLKKTTLDARSGILTFEVYDTDEHVVLVTKESALGQELLREERHFDAEGHLVRTESVIYASSGNINKTNFFSYSEMGSLLSISENGERTTRYGYTARQERSEVVKSDGERIVQEYDFLGRLVSAGTSEETIHYAYNLAGLPTQLENGFGSTVRVYDHRGNVIEETLANGLMIKKDFDALSRLKKLVYPDGSSTVYTYNSLYLRKVERFDALNHLLYEHNYIEYDKAGNLLLEEGAHGRIQHRYDKLSRRVATEGVSFSHRDEEFDSRGNVVSFELRGKVQEYVYNDLDQLIKEPLHTYAYDSHNNRLEKDSISHRVDILNQLLDDSATVYKYDDAGNLVQKGSTELTYDVHDRLVFVQQGSILVRYSYDALDRRMSKEVISGRKVYKEYYLYDERDEIGSFDAGQQNITLRVLGLGIGADIGAAVGIELDSYIYFPIHDLQGNVAEVYGKNGLFESYDYTAFGEESVYNGYGFKALTVENPWRFRSKRTDGETGFVLFGRRYYDPEVGRWITPDPKGLSEGPNLYAFLENSPLSGQDFYGLFLTREEKTSAFNNYRRELSALSQNQIYSPMMQSYLDRMNPVLVDQYRPSFVPGSVSRPPQFQGKLNGRIYFIPGVDNTRKDALVQISGVKEYVGANFPSYLVPHETRGLFADLVTVGHLKREHFLDNVRDAFAADMSEYLNKAGPEARILIVCSSGGAEYARAACRLLSKAQKQQIEILAIMPSVIISKNYAGVVNTYFSRKDPVALGSSILGISSQFLFKSNYGETRFLRSHQSVGWNIDHLFLSPTYREDIQKRVTVFLQNHNCWED